MTENILFLNHNQQQCGVYQYGKRSSDILKKSKQYNFIYEEINSEIDLLELVLTHEPAGIIYNYHPATMGWLTNNILSSIDHIKHYGLYHEGHETFNIKFDYYLIIDTTYVDSANMFSVLRPLFENIIPSIISPSVPTIGSFGFGFNNKGFERLVKLVNEEFDEAIIRLQIPFAYYGDRDGNSAREISEKCKRHITKSGIQLHISHEFLSNSEMLQFLSDNTLNAFLYDDMPGRGLSSVIDYALSVDVPIAITNTFMFRHIRHNGAICIENKSLKEIIESGSSVLNWHKEIWSHENFINKYEQILNKTL